MPPLWSNPAPSNQQRFLVPRPQKGVVHDDDAHQLKKGAAEQADKRQSQATEINPPFISHNTNSFNNPDEGLTRSMLKQMTRDMIDDRCILLRLDMRGAFSYSRHFDKVVQPSGVTPTT